MRAARGFTLVETLAAVFVLSVGMLGSAVTLLQSLADHGAAQRRLLAGLLLADLADRVRANAAAAAAYAGGAAADACEAGVECSGAQRAAADLAALHAAVHAHFAPGAGMHITYEPAIGAVAPDRVVLRLEWPEPREGAESVERVVPLAPVAG